MNALLTSVSKTSFTYKWCFPALYGLLVAALATRVVATDSQTVSATDNPDSFIKSFWAAKDALWSGIVDIELDKSDGAKSPKTSERYSLAYDQSQRSKRWAFGSTGNEAIYIETPENVLVHVPGSGVLSRFPTDHKVMMPEYFPRDPNLLGVASIEEWERNSMKDTRTFLEQGTKATVEHSNEANRIVWIYPILGRMEKNGPLKPTLNCKRIVTLENDKSLRVNHWSEEFEQLDGSPLPVAWKANADITYADVDGNSVPVHAHYESNVNQVERMLDVRLKWRSVNQTVDKTLFDAKAQNVPGGTEIVDNRVAAGVIESMIPRNGTNDLPGGPIRVGLNSDSTSNFRKALITINVVAVLVLAVLAAWKWRRQASL